MARKKQQQTFKNPYTLRRRFFTQQGTPKDWQDFGKGDFTDIKTVQRQIMMLKSNYINQAVEVEFKLGDKLMDFNGNETGETILYRRRDG